MILPSAAKVAACHPHIDIGIPIQKCRFKISGVSNTPGMYAFVTNSIYTFVKKYNHIFNIYSYSSIETHSSNSKANFVPCPVSLSTVISLPCLNAICFAIIRPSPVPF